MKPTLNSLRQNLKYTYLLVVFFLMIKCQGPEPLDLNNLENGVITFYDDADRSLIEAHLIGFRGDLYGESAKVRFVRRLRGERKFEGIEALKEQLVKDVADASKCLSD